MHSASRGKNNKMFMRSILLQDQYKYTGKVPITIAIRLRFDCDSASIRLRRKMTLTYCHDAHFDESNRSRIAIVIAA